MAIAVFRGPRFQREANPRTWADCSGRAGGDVLYLVRLGLVQHRGVTNPLRAQEGFSAHRGLPIGAGPGPVFEGRYPDHVVLGTSTSYPVPSKSTVQISLLQDCSSELGLAQESTRPKLATDSHSLGKSVPLSTSATDLGEYPVKKQDQWKREVTCEAMIAAREKGAGGVGVVDSSHRRTKHSS